jgi:hypothetical protein
MGNEGFEPALVYACQVENGITTITGAHTTQPAGIYKWLFGNCINGTQIVIHYLAAPVFTDLVIPLLALAIHTPPVRCYHDVTIGRHQLKIPPEGIGLS